MHRALHIIADIIYGWCVLDGCCDIMFQKRVSVVSGDESIFFIFIITYYSTTGCRHCHLINTVQVHYVSNTKYNHSEYLNTVQQTHYCSCKVYSIFLFILFLLLVNYDIVVWKYFFWNHWYWDHYFLIFILIINHTVPYMNTWTHEHTGCVDTVQVYSNM